MNNPQSPRRSRQGLASAAGVSLLLGATLAAAQERFEAPPTFRASDILPASVVSGPNHVVDERVVNDGLMNHYKIGSRFGEFAAHSDEEVLIRVDEVNAIARLDEVSRSEQFAKGVGKAGQDVLESAKGVLTDPVDTFKETGGGVKKLFGSARRSLSGEGGGIKDTVGYSRIKRQYALAFGVDPYSTNPVLQDQLSRVAQAGYVGDVGAGTALGFVSGGAGMALSASGHMHTLRETMRDRSPGELREMNEGKLQAMGVEQRIIDLFLGNESFSPSHQTVFVSVLEQLEGVAGRGELVQVAVLAKDEDQARFRVRQVQMYASYHRSVKPLRDFVPITKLVAVAGRTKGGVLVVNVPADHVALTRDLADYAIEADAGLEEAAGRSAKELWVAGGMSPLASEWFAANGWTVHAKARKRLLPDG